ncbi:MAG TPA: flagellar export protein FliJ [Alphaproteobacteria bacterium]|nr:flagellar export protein FliJ [Alphaproteobacteria bacterium]
MRALPNLIRLHKWSLDEARRKVTDLETLKASFRKEVAELEDELSREKEAARGSIDSLATLQGYYQHVRERRGRLAQSIAEIDTALERAREETTLAYGELKKYETALENLQKREQAEADKRQQLELDEVGLSMYRRKQASA